MQHSVCANLGVMFITRRCKISTVLPALTWESFTQTLTGKRKVADCLSAVLWSSGKIFPWGVSRISGKTKKQVDHQLNSVCSAAATAAAVISVKRAAPPHSAPLKWINSTSDCVVPEWPGRDESLLKQMRCYLSSGGGGECPDASRCFATDW